MHFMPIGQMLFAQQADKVAGIMQGIDSDKRFVLLIIAIGCTIPLVLGAMGIITSVIDTIHRRRAEIELKRDMIDRGMSAEEIVQVVESTARSADAKKC